MPDPQTRVHEGQYFPHSPAARNHCTDTALSTGGTGAPLQGLHSSEVPRWWCCLLCFKSQHMATATVSWGPPAAHFGKEVPALQSSARRFQQHASPAPVRQREGPKARTYSVLRDTQLMSPSRKKDRSKAKKGPTRPWPWNSLCPRPHDRAALPLLLIHVWISPQGTWIQSQPKALGHQCPPRKVYKIGLERAPTPQGCALLQSPICRWGN